MGKVYLYEDSSGSLYLHKHGDDIVYAHIELNVPYGARFDLDASELDGGVKGTLDVEKIPYSQLESSGNDPEIKRVAVWEDGKVSLLAHPGPDTLLYLGYGEELPQQPSNIDREV
ncbi:MAG TPA: hypothetical protein VFA07_02045 [Chthonomonadaceae bacterium]|nr:hypothetical protein [Chthonomonadaceae bacterium]